MTSRLLRPLVVIAVLALALAACGGGTATTDDATTPDAGATEPGTDTDLGTATETETDAATEPGATETATEDGAAGATSGQAQAITQAVDATLAEGSAAFEATVDIDTEQLTDSATSTGVVDFDGDRRQLEIETAAGTVRSLATPDGILLSIADQPGWVRVDPRQLEGTPLEAFGLASLPLQDPTVNLQLLRGVTEDVEELGTEDIDGESTTHYRVVVDVEDAAAQAEGVTQQQVSDITQQTGQSTVEMEVWIDESDRIRRIAQTVDLSEAEMVRAEADMQGTIDVTIDLRDFGTQVDIDEPAEGEVVDIDEETLEQLIRSMTPQQ
jgi:hypothetical protein